MLGHSTLLILSAAILLHHIVYANSDYDCKGIRTRRHAQISSPPNISGSWFSPSCEMLPGPQYVLRQYEFSSTESFIITRYYYSDEFCREPAYSIQARGTVTADSRSWYLNEATDMNIDLTELVIKPYTSHISQWLSQTLQFGCDVKTDWVSQSPPYQSALVSDVRNQECLQSLSFSVNELLVMRQVDYERSLGEETTTPPANSQYQSDQPHTDENSGYVERELQLGSVWFSQIQRPSSYQPPLYTVTHKHCEACLCIYRANMDSPPSSCTHHRYQTSHTAQLLTSSQTAAAAAAADITGEWFSQTCESVPNALFTLRSYKFNSTDETFNITTHYFIDTFCTKPTFTLNAQGQYYQGERHPRLYNTKSYQLIFKSLHVTVLSDYMLELMRLGNSTLCGHVTSWIKGRSYDVTGTRGCDTLGVSIPESSHVLIKVQKHPHSDFILLSELKNKVSDFYTKITQFSTKLKRCRTIPKRWVHYNPAENVVSTSTGDTNNAADKRGDNFCSLIWLGVILSFINPHQNV